MQDHRLSTAGRTTLLTCMELDTTVLLSLLSGVDVTDAVQNAGGVPTADALEAVAASRGTSLTNSFLIIIQHVGCEALPFTDLFRSLCIANPDRDLTTASLKDVRLSVQHALSYIKDQPISSLCHLAGYAYDPATASLVEGD